MEMKTEAHDDYYYIYGDFLFLFVLDFHYIVPYITTCMVITHSPSSIVLRPHFFSSVCPSDHGSFVHHYTSVVAYQHLCE